MTRAASGFVADLNNITTHGLVEQGMEILMNLDHRGARGAEPETGDGAGMLVQLPHAFLLRECSKLGMSLPEPGQYAVAQCFFQRERSRHPATKLVLKRVLDELGIELMGWREVPTDNSTLGASAVAGEPVIVADGGAPAGQLPHAGRLRATPDGGAQVRHTHGA